ncbi:MAG: transcription repressor NadR [Acutalibacteraceae bacterium]
MNGQKRREQILDLLSKSSKPLSGTALAKQLDVSRQAIVQDIALLRQAGNEIISTNSGYILQNHFGFSRVFKVIHSDDDAEKELELIVSYGGIVKDVFVYHKAYGVVKAEMNIRTRLDIDNFIADIRSGKSSLLKNITSNYHYHTVLAQSEEILDILEDKLWQAGFLAKLQDYEPVDFNKQ